LFRIVEKSLKKYLKEKYFLELKIVSAELDLFCSNDSQFCIFTVFKKAAFLGIIVIVVVTCGQACLDGLLPVAEDLELWQRHVRRNLPPML
jgi:hypothetical protein